MKILDVNAFEMGMDETNKKITMLSSQMKQVEQSIDQLIGLTDAFKGEGPQAILMFYEQYHKPLLKTYHTFSTDYQLTIENMRKALLNLEPARDGFIRQSFLENELEQGILRAKNTTIQLTSEANAIMQTVSDIVALPPLREDGVVRACDEAIKFKDETIEKLVHFDNLQTKAVLPVDDILQSITEQIQFMEDIFIKGDINANAQTNAVDGLSLDRQVSDLFKTLPFQKAMEHIAKAKEHAIVMTAIKHAINPDKFLTEAQRIYNQMKKGRIYKTILWATRIFFSPPSQGEYNEKTIEDENIFVKSWDSFKGIGRDFMDGLDSRTKKVLDSSYDFANYLTLGAVDGIWSGSKDRNEKKWNSFSDFFNYASFGFTGMVKGAVNPKDPFSKEHWLDSFGVATTITGVKGVSSKKTTGGSGKTTSNSSNGSSTKVTDKFDDPYIGVKQASEYLKSQGVPRQFRKPTLESFEIGTIRLDVAGSNTYGLRFYDDINAYAKGRYLFETFSPQVNRSNLALPPDWNRMTGIQQWKVKPDTIIIKGKAGSQFQMGDQYIGGVEQWYITNLESLIKP